MKGKGRFPKKLKLKLLKSHLYSLISPNVQLTLALALAYLHTYAIWVSQSPSLKYLTPSLGHVAP
jgi:hypothetical protein